MLIVILKQQSALSELIYRISNDSYECVVRSCRILEPEQLEAESLRQKRSHVTVNQ